MPDCVAIQCGVQASPTDVYTCAQGGYSGVRSALDPLCARYQPPTVLSPRSNPQPLTINTLTTTNPDITLTANVPPSPPPMPPSFLCELSRAIQDYPVHAVLVLAGATWLAARHRKGR
jgi:hypothetical protein